MSEPTQRIAIQSKGRLRTDSLRWLQASGLELPTISERSLLVNAKNKPVELLFVRHSDIPRYVQSGAAAYGIVGANIVRELEPRVVVLQRFNFGECCLVIAVPQDSPIKTISDLAGHRIATSYPNSLKKFLRANDIAAAVIEISGCVEIAPQLNLADAICDLTQSGQTLAAHQLIPLVTILESQAVLIQSPLINPDALNFLTV